MKQGGEEEREGGEKRERCVSGLLAPDPLCI